VTDTPIYDQLRLELSSRREPQDTAAPPRPRARATEKSVEKSTRQAPTDSSADTRQPVSVWTLVNANRRRRS
jgi:hypothetical protein